MGAFNEATRNRPVGTVIKTLWDVFFYAYDGWTNASGDGGGWDDTFEDFYQVIYQPEEE